MGKSSATLVKWREYFLTANTDIFDIIESAIMIAASDCPKEFKMRRDRIAELLFTCKVTKCFGCDKLELVGPGDGQEEGEREEEEEEEKEGAGSKDSKVGDDLHLHHHHHHHSSYSYGDAEALTDEIEQESQMFGEVMRIKEILDNKEDESEAVLYDSLRRLELMALSVEVLKGTEIGKSVNALRRHGSQQIRQLAKTLVDGWVAMVDEWMAVAVAAANEGTPESMKKSDLVNEEEEEEEEGLPSPPLDEGFLFGSQSIPMELSQLFDDMDDDGNPQNCGEFNKTCDSGRKQSVENQNVPKQPVENQNVPKRKQQIQDEALTRPKDRKSEQQMKKQEPLLKKQETVKQQPDVVKLNKPMSGGSGPGRPTKPGVDHHRTNPQQNSGVIVVQKRGLPSQQNKMRSSGEASDVSKFEAAKRKLQERYQEAEKAKRQRTVQVMELHDLPKQNLGQRNPNARPGNRHRANGRR